MGLFDGVLGGIQDRLGALTANSPFTANPLGGANPFAGGSPFGGGNAFANNPFGNVQSPFGNSNPFGNTGNLFGNNPFGNTGNIFGNPLGQANVFNPYNSSENDPFGTGIMPKKAQTTAGGTGGNGANGDMNFTGPATSDDNKQLTGQAIDNWIRSTRPNSPLVGQGNYILQAANAKGISVPMLLGIMLNESQLGSDNSYLPQHYNYGGLTGSGWRGQTGNTQGMARDFAMFDNMQDGIQALVDNLATSTYKGKSVQQQVGTWYLGDPNADLTAQDEQGNMSVAKYLQNIASVYQGLGVGYNSTAQPTAKGTGTTGLVHNNNWESTAMSYTKQGGKWVDYSNEGIRVTGNPADGMDCSSFVGYVMGLPRDIWNAQQEYNAAKAQGSVFTDISKAQKGDLIFFTGTYDAGTPVTHVGIYLGNGKMIHTGTVGRGVEVVPVANLQKYFYGIGRL